MLDKLVLLMMKELKEIYKVLKIILFINRYFNNKICKRKGSERNSSEI